MFEHDESFEASDNSSDDYYNVDNSEEDDDNDLLLPEFEPLETKRDKLGFFLKFMGSLSDISKVSQVALSRCLQIYDKITSDTNNNVRMHQESVRRSLENALPNDDRTKFSVIYDKLSRYYLKNFKCQVLFRKVFKYPMPKSDVIGKTTMCHHLFVELCRLRFIVRIDYILFQGPAFSTSKHVKDFIDQSVIPQNRGYKSIYAESQREIVQDLYTLSKFWKTIQMSNSLDQYVDTLFDRVSMFFLYSSTSDYMDDDRYRNAVPASMLTTPIRVELDQFGEEMIDNDEDSYDETLDYYPLNETRHRRTVQGASYKKPIRVQYYPSLVFSTLCQFYMVDYLGSKMVYFKFNKYDAYNAIETCTRELSRIHSNHRLNFSKWFSIDVLKRWVHNNWSHVVSEFSRDISDKYIYNSFSSAEEMWLYKNDEGTDMSSNNYLSTLKSCRPTEEVSIVKKSRTPLKELMVECREDCKKIGFYEWCVVRLLARMFALQMDFVHLYVIGRDQLYVNQLKLSIATKPRIVQYFSKYYVFYKNALFVPPQTFDTDLVHSELHAKTNDTIFDAVLLWIGIMLRDFPNHKHSRGISMRLKEYCEQPVFTDSSEIRINDRQGDQTFDLSNIDHQLNMLNRNNQMMGYTQKRKIYLEQMKEAKDKSASMEEKHTITTASKKNRALPFI